MSEAARWLHWPFARVGAVHWRDGRLIVSATDLVSFLECGHLTLLDRAAAAGLVHKPDRADDPAVELLQWRGGEHEKRYIEQLVADGRRITDLKANKGLSYVEQAAATEEQMRRGDDVIYQGTVFDGRWVGHPDFLLRVDGHPLPLVSGFDGVVESDNRLKAEGGGPWKAGEVLVAQSPVRQLSWLADSEPPQNRLTEEGGPLTEEGGRPRAGDGRLTEEGGRAKAVGEPAGLGTDWHYEVADTKLAHIAKASALIQICSYVEHVERIQGVTPEKVYVVTGGAEATPRQFRTADMMAYFRRAKRRFEEALDEATVGLAQYPIPRATSYPDPVEHCAVCRWNYVECRRVWHEDDALPIVAGITRSQRKELRGLGIDTRRGLAGSELRGFDNVREQARLQVASDGRSVPVFELLEPERDAQGQFVANRGLSALPPPSDYDIFFDFEGDPFAFWEGLEYLFGIWDGAVYRPYWAMNRREEKQQFEQVMDLFHGHWRLHPQMHVYHYGVYEPSRLKTLCGRHATRQDELDDLLRAEVFVDLYRVVRQGVRVGSERYSIKNLEPLYGFTRVIELRDANSSIVEFEKLLETGDPGGELQEMIAGYNKDDCVSTERLRDWLEERRLDAARQFGGELPRPVAKAAEPNEELSDRIRAVRELEGRLTASIDRDPATWLVANLLEWHRREDKSTWWRYYDLMSKSDEELIDEPEPIGGLQFLEMFELGGRARSNIHRYRFPRQEHKIEVGNSLNDPRLFAAGEKTGTGSVEAIDDEAGTIEIKRGRGWSGPHPTSVVALDVIDAKAQREALFRLGEWVAQHGIDSAEPAWQAARDLLLRRAPRILGGEGGGLKRDGEPGSVAARRLAPLLDGTTLAIQGPPGSGKTYTGARMILDLVRDGRKVGISSNSHKVIGNLLEAVLDAARDERVAVRIIQKAKEHEAILDDAVRRVEDNGDVADALNGGEVDIAAGTPWLWAREEMAGLVETLFVDEAGQVSLANVVAMSAAARNVVLLGDPQQLDQPTQGVHPDGAGVSALTHLLDGAKTVPTDHGLFLERTYRMHPRITDFTSELFYEGKLQAVDGLVRQEVLDAGPGAGPAGFEWLAGSGLRWVPVEHDGNANASEDEARKVVEIVSALVERDWIDSKGEQRPIGRSDIRIVSPFNAHRLVIGRLLKEAGLEGVPVGTVDKFQGQQAPVSIYTMATSRAEDAPRGLDFLYSLNRLNVATSRARALAIVVASPRLLDALAHTPDQLRMVNGLCAFVEASLS